MNILTIGKLAKKTDLSAVTIRYYEKIKLISASMRSPNGYRLYFDNVIPKIKFIQKAKTLGFTLTDIKLLLSIYDSKQPNSHAVRQKVVLKLQDIQQKMFDLKKIHSSLKKLLLLCDGSQPIKLCPIIQNIFN